MILQYAFSLNFDIGLNLPVSLHDDLNIAKQFFLLIWLKEKSFTEIWTSLCS